MVPIEIEDACSSRRPVGRSERVQVVLIGHPRQTSEYVTHISERIFAVTLTRDFPTGGRHSNGALFSGSISDSP